MQDDGTRVFVLQPLHGFYTATSEAKGSVRLCSGERLVTQLEIRFPRKIVSMSMVIYLRIWSLHLLLHRHHLHGRAASVLIQSSHSPCSAAPLLFIYFFILLLQAQICVHVRKRKQYRYLLNTVPGHNITTATQLFPFN